MRPCVSGVVPPTDRRSRRRRASETLDVGRSTTSAVRFLKMTTATRSLQRRCGANGGVDGQVTYLFLRLGADVAASAIGRLAGRTLAALLADPSLSGQVDTAQVEGLQRVRGRLVAARAACRDAGVGAG